MPDTARLTLPRRRFLRVSLAGAATLLLAACQAAPPASPTKPADAPKPTAQPAASPKLEAAKPAASPSPGASPSPAASPSPSPAAQLGPAASVAALPRLDGVTLSVLQWTSFIPESDPFFKKQIEDDFSKQTGARVNLELVNANDLQPKISAAIQGGSGPDVVLFQNNWPHLYRESIVDVTDVAEAVRNTTGEFFPAIEAAIKIDGRYYAVPHDFVGDAMHYRASWFKEAGAQTFPGTYAELFEVGKKLKASDRPIGQALGHSFGDPANWCYPMLWGYGGREVDEQGKVAINSPETITAVKTMKEAWPDAYDETGLAWDDSSNNRAFLAGTISATWNGASVWWLARKDQSPFFDDIALASMPAGPKGRFPRALTNSYAIMKYSKNVDAAKAFIAWTMRDEVWYPWFELNGSYYSGVGPKHDATPIWDTFPPVTRTFKGLGPTLRTIGWPGPYDQRAGLSQSKYIVVDMFAKAVQGDSPEAAVSWAEDELRQIYT